MESDKRCSRFMPFARLHGASRQASPASSPRIKPGVTKMENSEPRRRVTSACRHLSVPGQSRLGRRDARAHHGGDDKIRSEEHTSELQSLMRISYAVFCLKKKTPSVESQYKRPHDHKHHQNITHI